MRAARERGELRMLQRDDADAPWAEIPFTLQETADGGVAIVLSVQTFGDFALITSEPRLQTAPLHADWNVVAWDGADGAAIADALSDIGDQVDVIYQWLAETQTWRSHRPGAPPARSAFDSFTRGATYWIRAGEAVEWTIIGGPLLPPATGTVRLHAGWTEVVWDGPDGAAIASALGALLDRGRRHLPVGRRDADLAQLPPGRPQRLRHLPDGRQLLDRRDGGGGVDRRRRMTGLTGGSDPSGN